MKSDFEENISQKEIFYETKNEISFKFECCNVVKRIKTCKKAEKQILKPELGSGH